MSNRGGRKTKAKVVKKKFIEDEPEEYTAEELGELIVSEEEELEEETPAPKVGSKRAAPAHLEKATAKAAKVQPKPSAPAVKVSVPKPKPAPAPVSLKGKEKVAPNPTGRNTARGKVEWVYGEDTSLPNIDLDDYEELLSRLYINRKGSKGWNFEVGYYVESDEEWLANGGEFPRQVKPIRFCLAKPHRMHFPPSRWGDGQFGQKIPEQELRKKPFGVSADMNLDNEKDDFDLKLANFYQDFRRAVGELILKKVAVEDVRHFFELPPADNCEFWYANPFMDDNFFKGLVSIGDEGTRAYLKIKFPLSWKGEPTFTLGDLSIPSSPRSMPSPEYIAADEGIAGTFEFGDIWIAKVKRGKPDPTTGLHVEEFASGQHANASIVWRFSKMDTEKVCGPPPASGQDVAKLEANKNFNMAGCGFLQNFATLDN